MKLVVGLGNPGRDYARTRHNIGFMVLDALAGRLGCEFRRAWFLKALATRADTPEGRVLLVKPQTFMNRSGEAVAAVLRWHRLAPADMIVVLDDVDLPLGKLRIRKQGSAGHHNGLKSIIGQVGTDEFVRLRLGIEQAERRGSLSDFVLGSFAREETDVSAAAIRQAVEALECLLSRGVDAAMNQYNGL